MNVFSTDADRVSINHTGICTRDLTDFLIEKMNEYIYENGYSCDATTEQNIYEYIGGEIMKAEFTHVSQ